MDIFDFEELVAEMLGVTDEEREDDDFLPTKFYEKFDVDFELAYEFAKALLPHTPTVQAGMSRKHYHAFLSKHGPFMHMKMEAKNQQGEG